MDGFFRERQVCTINTSEFEFPVVTRPLPFTQFRVTASNAERTFGKELRRRSVARDDRLLLETVQKILGPHNVEAANAERAFLYAASVTLLAYGSFVLHDFRNRLQALERSVPSFLVVQRRADNKQAPCADADKVIYF